MTTNLPQGRRFLVSLVLESELGLHRGDQVLVTTSDGLGCAATVASEPLDLSRTGAGVPTGVSKVGDTTIIHLDTPGVNE